MGLGHILAIFVLYTSLGQGLGTSTDTLSIITDELINILPDTFLSIALDSSLVRERWRQFDFRSKELHTLASALSPCVLRFGGTDADFLIFDPNNYDYNGPREHKNFTMSAADFDNLNIFAKSVGCQLLFDLNILLRKGSKWDPTNALELLQYAVNQGYGNNLHFELGNEPNAFKHAVGVELSATQIGSDFLQLKDIIKSKFSGHFITSKLVGPDVTKPKVENNQPMGTYRNVGINSLQFLQEYLSVVNHSLDAITWHQYYIDGRTATVDDFTDPEVLNLFYQESLAVIHTLRDAGHSSVPLWLGETGSAWGGGAEGISDTYVAGFLWLDKLGAAAKLGHKLVLRQSFYHGHYAMLDEDMNPLPDYWLSVLYKRLVGNGVFKILQKDVSGYIRMYCHCASNYSYDPGAITIYAMNLYSHDVNITINLKGMGSEIHEYILSPYDQGSLQSKRVALNSKLLKMESETKIPPLVPNIRKDKQSFQLPRQTFGFFVLPDANVELCE